MINIIKILLLVIIIKMSYFININDDVFLKLIKKYYLRQNENAVVTNDINSKIDPKKHLVYSSLAINESNGLSSPKDIDLKNNMFSWLNNRYIDMALNYCLPFNIPALNEVDCKMTLLFQDMKPCYYIPKRYFDSTIRYWFIHSYYEDVKSREYYSEMPYVFPQYSTLRREWREEFYKLKDIMPEGKIVQFKFPTDEIEIIYSDVALGSTIIETYNGINDLILKKYDKSHLSKITFN